MNIEILDSNNKPIPRPYSHAAMIDFILQNPTASPQDCADRFGRSRAWFFGVLANEQFQQALDPVRHLVQDPEITATMQERMRALAMQAAGVIGERIESGEADNYSLVRSLEVGTKALGMGNASMTQVQEKKTITDGIEGLADRLLTAMNRAKRLSASQAAADDVEVKS